MEKRVLKSYQCRGVFMKKNEVKRKKKDVLVFGAMSGSLKIVGDIIKPINDKWNACIDNNKTRDYFLVVLWENTLYILE